MEISEQPKHLPLVPVSLMEAALSLYVHDCQRLAQCQGETMVTALHKRLSSDVLCLFVLDIHQSGGSDNSQTYCLLSFEIKYVFSPLLMQQSS